MGQGQSQFEEDQASKHTFTPYTKHKTEDWYMNEEDKAQQSEYQAGYVEQGATKYYHDVTAQGEKLVPRQPSHRGLNIRLTRTGTRKGGRILTKPLFYILACLIIMIISIVHSFSILHATITDIKPAPQIISKVYTVGANPTLIVHDDNSRLNIHVGNTKGSNSIIIHANDAPEITSDMNDNIVEVTDYSTDGNIDITVPQRVDIQIDSKDGDVVIAGVDGKVNVSTQVAAVYLSESTLLTASQVTTVGGQIELGAKFDAQGKYLFSSLSGNIAVTTAPGEAIHFIPSTLAGTVTNLLPKETATQGQAAEIHIQTTTGAISIGNTAK